ncbi:pyridoxal phosphate-dependent decarboxylase family protein [Streptomyces marispadix]|uniref:Aminotransferase class V-fold PLP-dependent enzyme n=1 Tax=Streptomyces marispadix TaxID=2922868 RepID=A0ABS9T2L2_9ACTN|nr:aminotransferase class V-fold PLP-dependent enzyme [Streptomyces marispadix]MCH6162759.1 aminotransferase class V-fold PLP-dependent enzyme [Streptomyces marispadix]
MTAAALPPGRPADDVLAELRALRLSDAPTRGGRTFAYVYDSGLDGLDELASAAYSAYATVNGLDMTVFPSVARLENDIVRSAAALLGAPGVQGTFTSGGTESILLAVKTARDHARAVRGVREPRMVLPSTAHAAFHKAAAYLGVEPVVVPVDRETYRAPAAAMADALDEHTALVVVSAPSYAHGVIDPVEEVAAAAAERDVLCHVDACIGGWLLPYLRRAGREVPPFEMTLPGVTSLSVDLHKYGYADKGASVVLYRDGELRRHQYFAHARWPGYPVVNPTVQGTKSAGLLAQAWAVLRHVGDDGYTALARQVSVASDRLLAGLRAVEGLRILGRPTGGLVAFTLDGERGAGDGDLSLVLHLADEMRLRGWYLQPQLGFDGMPPNLHLTLTPATVGQVDALLADLGAALTAARALAPVGVDPELAALAATLDPDTLGPDEAAYVLAYAGLDGNGNGNGNGGSGEDGDGSGGGGGGAAVKERMAPVLAMLDALPAPLKERLLAEFVGSVFRI